MVTNKLCKVKGKSVSEADGLNVWKGYKHETPLAPTFPMHIPEDSSFLTSMAFGRAV